MNEQEIFLQLLDLETPRERTEFLADACGGDNALRERVQALLHSHDDAGSFLEAPAVEPGKTVIADGSTDDLVSRVQISGDHTVVSSDAAPLALDFLEPADKPGYLGRLGQYDVIEVLGRGGMGIVLRANDPHLNRIVAIKTLAPDYANNPTARKRFAREGQAAAAVSHPHVVTIHAVEPNGRVPYLVMELVQGQSLKQKLDKTGCLELKEILRIGAQTAQGLAAAHGQGLIHRDVKPGNVLLENGVERVKLTDFGLARATDDVAITRTGDIAGTPQFMSPEQAEGKPVDHRSDLFSLGSVLYSMCTGRPPFRGETTVAVLRKVCDGEPRPIREVNPDLPEWLADIVAHLLAKDPQHRFQTAAEVARVLNEHLAELQNPGSASAPKFERRLPTPKRALTPWTAITVAALMLICSLGVTEATGVTKISPTIIRLFTGDGTLIVEVDDPNVNVTIDGEEIVITGAGPNELRLKPGKYRVSATKDGATVSNQLVTVERDGRQVVKISTEAGVQKTQTHVNKETVRKEPRTEVVIEHKEVNGNSVYELSGKKVSQEELAEKLSALAKEHPKLVVHVRGDLNFETQERQMIELHKMFYRSGVQSVMYRGLSRQANPPNPQRFWDLAKRLVFNERRMAAIRAKHRNKIKQIVIACHNHHDIHRSLPPNSKNKKLFDGGGKPHLSWRVHLLPYMNAADLYEQFHLDEPWDSEHNKRLLGKMPEAFKTTEGGTKTTMMMVVGKGTAYEGEGGLAFRDFKDGTANTILLIDAGADKAVPWTKPVDIPFQPKDPIVAFGEPTFENEFLCGMVDGSVPSIPTDITPTALLGMLTRAGGDTGPRSGLLRRNRGR